MKTVVVPICSDKPTYSGDHVHLGPGVTAQRKTNPAVSMDELPPIDAILLSHFHEGMHTSRVHTTYDTQGIPLQITSTSTSKNDSGKTSRL
jgi:Cft2 family RNA processing exonuclease